jgi:hypothetical protein
MAQESHPSDRAGWVEAIGLPHIVRTLGFAVDPGKLGLGAAAVILTIALGGLLDWVWTAANFGVGENAVAQMVTAPRLQQTYEEPEGEHGMFGVWWNHERENLLGLLALSPGGGYAAVDPTEMTMMPSPGATTRWGSLCGMGDGVWWLFRYHTLYFVLFGAGTLLIWSLAGGAICRMAAVQFTRDEKPTIKQAMDYTRSRLFGGYFLAPCIPLVFALIAMILLAIGGIVLRIPLLGDILAGAAFFLAIFGGFVVAALLIGLVVGGSLLWPTVATEGSDAFDAFSRSLSYVFSKPWKTVIYAVLSLIYIAICWWLVRWFVFIGLATTRIVVGFGTSPFGWLSRGAEGEHVSKLDLIWPLGGIDALYSWPDWSSLEWYEYISAVLIAIYVLLVVALMWSFLASFYYSASTVIYMLLRRDVDGTDLADIYDEEPEQGDVQTPIAQPAAATPTSDVLPPATPSEPAPPPSSSGSEPGDDSGAGTGPDS